jgi:hypothetical protein
MKVRELIDILKSIDGEKYILVGAMNCCGDYASATEHITVVESSEYVSIHGEDE